MDKAKNKWKIFNKEITRKETRKYSTSTCITVLSNRTVKKESGGRGHRRKNEFIYLKLNKENNIRTMVLKIYLHSLIEAFKMRLLSTAESLESPKRSNSTFKWLGKFLKDELMLDMSMKRDFKHFQNWDSVGKKFHCLQPPNCSYMKSSRYLKSHV